MKCAYAMLAKLAKKKSRKLKSKKKVTVPADVGHKEVQLVAFVDARRPDGAVSAVQCVAAVALPVVQFARG